MLKPVHECFFGNGVFIGSSYVMLGRLLRRPMGKAEKSNGTFPSQVSNLNASKLKAV